MARSPRPLSEHDQAVWATYVRHVKALAGRDVSIPHAPPVAHKVQPASPAAPPRVLEPVLAPAKPRPTALVTGLHPPGLDTSTWNRFRSGKLPASRTLDLHGKTAQAAFHALVDFLHAARGEKIRCVEIITGRGSGEHGGVIRRELPLWLNLPSLRPLVLAASHPHPMNPGSTRLLLKRK